ncbi:DUF5819 family protein [Staphylococcus schweitzeri]|uniref:Uncharacterized protein n=1 Tax=Staphylococcus schweitzeri TaxID=1654388 RepID=A0A077UND7_9STAP|nr:DUF5819 family protein [Staphylococcus schweitzeri]CDR29227.1 hypothetical protein ERS140147_02432 [Staphylococcus schweitzeri]
MARYKYLLPIILVLLLFVHFSLITIVVSPFNPISSKIGTVAGKYVNPLFTQTWTLFAPDPIDRNTSLQIKYEYKNGQKSNWIDSGSNLTKNMHSNYFSPYNRIGRIPETIISEMVSEDPIVLKLKNYYSENNMKKELEVIEKQNEEKFNTNLPKLQKFANAYLKSTVRNPNNIKNVDMRIIKKEAIPFSKRKSMKSQPWQVIYNFERFKYDNEIPPLI